MVYYAILQDLTLDSFECKIHATNNHNLHYRCVNIESGGNLLHESFEKSDKPKIGVFTMTTVTEKILHDLAELPTEMQTEALDFIKFLQAKLAKNKALNTETKPNGLAIAEILEKASKRNLFADIDDPVAWQREIRKDRPLPEREK